MRSISIKQRLIGLVGVAVATTVTVALLAWDNGRVGRHAADHLASTTTAVRASMNADMMHDSIRASVFAAQIAAAAGDTAGLEAAAEEFEGSAKAMLASYKEAAEATRSLGSARDVKAAGPVVIGYVAAAREAIGAIKGRPGEVKQAVATYLVAFKATEEALEKSGDAIERVAQAIEADTGPS